MSKIKDPDARLDYAFDWSAWLQASETIVSHTVTLVPAFAEAGDAALDGSDEDAGVVTFWLEGGDVGTTAKVTCHIVTSDGREDDRTMTITIRER